jgi:hypothetical protein
MRRIKTENGSSRTRREDINRVTVEDLLVEFSNQGCFLEGSRGRLVTSLTTAMGAVPAELAPAPQVTVYDCKHGQSLPGTPVPNPGSSTDAIRSSVQTDSQRLGTGNAEVFYESPDISCCHSETNPL